MSLYTTSQLCIQYLTALSHQQNVNRSGSDRQTSQTLPQTTPVLPSNSRCSQAPLELSKVLSDSARAFSGAPESTCSNDISNNPSFRLKHPGVPDGSDGSGGTSYPLTENQTRPVTQATGRVAYLPCGGYYTMRLIGFLYFASGMWWRIRTTRTTRMLHSSQGL